MEVYVTEWTVPLIIMGLFLFAFGMAYLIHRFLPTDTLGTPVDGCNDYYNDCHGRDCGLKTTKEQDDDKNIQTSK